MSAYTTEGTLWIELADLYGWLANQGHSIEHCKPPRFSIADDALVLEHEDGRTPAYIDAAELWAWILDAHLPRGLNDEVAFGVPRVEGSDLVVTFAASNESDPRSWAAPPACLAEWVRPIEQGSSQQESAGAPTGSAT